MNTIITKVASSTRQDGKIIFGIEQQLIQMQTYCTAIKIIFFSRGKKVRKHMNYGSTFSPDCKMARNQDFYYLH